MALIPPFFLDCVVAIGFANSEGKPNYAATGFLYGRFLKQEGEMQSYTLFLITNKHVVATKDSVWLRFNPEGNEPAQEFKVDLINDSGNQIWLCHDDEGIDLAVVTINPRFLDERGIRYNFFQSKEHVVDRHKALELGLSEGDGVFVMGFPMGLVGNERNFVIVRQGAIARISDFLNGSSKEILLDAAVFPGNSGAPVVTRPEIMSITGTKAITSAYLIGVVAAYVPYQDIAISNQTKRPRVIFEENSGLASVVPIDYVIEIIEEFVSRTKPVVDAPPVEVPQDLPG